MSLRTLAPRCGRHRYLGRLRPSLSHLQLRGEGWASGARASLAAGEQVLSDGTALFCGSFSLLTEDLSISLPADAGDQADFTQRPLPLIARSGGAD